MTYRILFGADFHVEHSFVDDHNFVLEVFEKTLETERPDVVVLAGDVSDEHGHIVSRQGVIVQRSFERALSRGLTEKIVYAIGNHEYDKPLKPESYGRSTGSTLFRNAPNIHVADDEARFFRVKDDLVILAIPYRDSWEEYERTCHAPILRALDEGAVKEGDHVEVVWHVGLPFGLNHLRGDENENNWIKPDHPAVQLLFKISTHRRIFCGHYHTPSDTTVDLPDGEKGRFIYIGSPQTRSRSESEEEKRFLLVEGSSERSIPTGLITDKVVSSTEEAAEHIRVMRERFGDKIVRLLKTHVILPEGSSLDDYAVENARRSALPGQVAVYRPRIVKRGQMDHLVERQERDPSYSRVDFQKDVFRESNRVHFRSKALKTIDEAKLSKIASEGHAEWLKATRDETMRTSLEARHGLALTPDLCLTIARFIHASRRAEEICGMV